MKAKQSKAAARTGESYKNGVPMKFVDRDLRGVNPLKEQFAPTPAEPVRAHVKMAGGC